MTAKRIGWQTVKMGPHYRGASFEEGLRAAGFDVRQGASTVHFKPGDVLVIWNRYPGSGAVYAEAMDRKGGAVIVAENGYVGEDADRWQFYALARDHHAGRGRWPHKDGIAPAGRWNALGIEVAPWRASGRHILVLGQRGFGHPKVAMPKGWDREAEARLRGMTGRPVRFRPHPGRYAGNGPSLAAALEGCHAVVTWSSGAAIKALIAGVPVFCGFDRWIGAPASRRYGHDIEDPLLDDEARLKMLHRLAWAQWSLAEIRSGEPFRLLLT